MAASCSRHTAAMVRAQATIARLDDVAGRGLCRLLTAALQVNSIELVKDFHAMVLAVALALGLLHHLGDFVALGVHGGQRLESLIGLLVEHMALSHVLAHDQVESVVSVAHQVLHQVVQLAVLLLKMREGQAAECSAFLRSSKCLGA
eukprot:CAMPEP_0185572836 /NCGR_PEP_ID=MMETSP0434-20130131/4690_1 /TAXON_ID=626734 ORGANISM="Favella taraikaensis, Strain Fe Narragansett Bay" /NCGR_SAMPLE_ID=MMETSP0434 /ASSEMBLY_ACC=CAM_ASM_000379 /LENGTH=146 /DNA_ID=CAMNT_0028188849 /DNA_START=1238 /DNA_END=1680 /DNA_ORIENTATION=-